MYVVIGTLLIALAVLGFTVAVLATRKPNPPAWNRYTLAHEFVAVAAVSLVSFGFALVAESIALLKQNALTTMDVILTALILVAFSVIWKRLRVGATLAEYARQKEGAIPVSHSAAHSGLVPDGAGASPGSMTSMSEDPDSPTRPRTPRWRKKAA